MFVMVICINASAPTPVTNATVFTTTKGSIKIRQKRKVFNENNLKFAFVKPLFVVTGNRLTTIQTILDYFYIYYPESPNRINTGT